LNLESITRKVLLKELRERGVRFLTGRKLLRVDEAGVVVAAEDGTESFVEADVVVVAVGNKPDNSLYEQIQSFGIPLYQIGDCLEPRSAKAAISEAATIGRSI
jgi:pyruvate/2-oxoglutarate dehydrogenase complex dihydrolipoamide dehydrogenase (E3) component